MSGKTENQYKRSLRGSVGAGVSALFNGDGRRYFILVHKDASQYHTVGETQKIIVDEVEIGRDSACQVRFDESLGTVSRRHAAIVKAGDGWKLVQLSKTNSTFLNGNPVETEWYLKNGDEIQLSIGGPRLGFIVPEGKQSLVSSIKMTERLELFRKQALKPYKTAIACMLALVVLVGCGSGYGIWRNCQNIDIIIPRIAEIDTLGLHINHIIKDVNDVKEIIKHPISYPKDNLSKLLSSVEDDVFFINTTKVVISDGDDEIELDGYGWTGTGFLTSDGRFVTAKHCISGWLFGGPLEIEFGDSEEVIRYKNKINRLISYATTVKGWKIVAYFTAESRTKKITFNSSEFVMDNSTEHTFDITEDGLQWRIETSLAQDWAYCRTNQRGSIVLDSDLSTRLPKAAELHILGFPFGFGATDTNKFGCHYNSCVTSKDGIDEGIIRVGNVN